MTASDTLTITNTAMVVAEVTRASGPMSNAIASVATSTVPTTVARNGPVDENRLTGRLGKSPRQLGETQTGHPGERRSDEESQGRSKPRRTRDLARQCVDAGTDRGPEPVQDEHRQRNLSTKLGAPHGADLVDPFVHPCRPGFRRGSHESGVRRRVARVRTRNDSPTGDFLGDHCDPVVAFDRVGPWHQVDGGFLEV